MSYCNPPINRRQLLKTVGASIAGATLLPACSSEHPQDGAISNLKPAGNIGLNGKPVLPWSNWSGNQRCQPSLRNVPRSHEQLAKLIRESTQSIRCLGSGHSFSPLVPTDETLISLARFRGVKNIDTQNQQATFGAGTLLGQIGDPLWDAGLALRNMPDINTQSLAGAIATSTHGTGQKFGSLSSDVTALTMVTSQGDILNISPNQNADLFNATRAGLGALGVVTDLTLNVREKYNLHEKQWIIPNTEAFPLIEEFNKTHKHYEVYAFPHGDYSMIITFDETDKAIDDEFDHTESGDAILELKKWTERLPWIRSYLVNSGLKDASKETHQRINRSYRVFGNLRNVRFNEMEYSVPAERGLECLEEILASIKKENIEVVFPLEYRYIKADDIWLSQFYKRDSCAISCHNFADRDYKYYFSIIEPIFRKYDGRPHWGKIHTLTANDFAQMYPMWDEFKRVRNELDPKGLFLNKHIKELFVS